MKTKTIIIAMATILMAGIIALLAHSWRAKTSEGSFEALSACEVSNGKKTLWKCAGNVGTCDVKVGQYTLTCSGVKK